MDKNFWLSRWEREETGFHQAEVNPYLRKHWRELNLPENSAVFVPLCGKSHDMIWLQQQGHPVLGVELSAIAVQSFFNENGFIPHHDTTEKFNCCEAGRIRILCGDFFDLCKDDLADVRAVYDRASLIALPPDMRERYIEHLMRTLPVAANILLVTLDYPQSEMQGPPFAVSSAEVETLFGKHAEVRLLEQTDVLSQNPRFQQRGLSSLQESVFLLTRSNTFAHQAFPPES